MININTQNITKQKIGSKHGFSERKIKKFCEKNDPIIQGIFKSKNQFGYAFSALAKDDALVRKIKRFATDQKKNKWENIVVLGIGGSSLGMIAMQEALLGAFHNLGKKPRLFVVDNVDPTYTSQLLDNINISKTFFVVISKSGTTTEPMSLYSIIKERLVKKHPKTYQKHLLFITDPKTGLLRKIAQEEGINTFDVPTKVGGRFSVLSSVGLVPAALVGIDINKLLKGATAMRDEIKKKKGVDNPASILATVQFLMNKKKDKPMTVMMPYSNALFRLSDWYCQLLAESIGKNEKTGITPLSALGSTDQHSQIQLYNEGPNDKLILFLRAEKHQTEIKTSDNLPEELKFLEKRKMSDIMDACYQGTAESLAQNNRPNITLNISKINEETLGALFILFEFQVAILGELYKVDTFNQPGVEKGKIITKSCLNRDS